jgi:hypothetical protein
MKVLDFMNRERQEIRIKEDWANKKVYLINSNKNAIDSLEVNDVAEIDTAIVLFDSFIIIEYRCNGGSGVHLRLSKLFCINNGHIYEPLSLLTQQESYSSDGELQEKYWVDIHLKFAKNKYRAILIENEKNNNGDVFKKDHKILFDQKEMIFFSQRKRSSNISFCSLQPHRKVAYYQISLKKENYINYEGIWYKKGAKCYKRM